MNKPDLIVPKHFKSLVEKFGNQNEKEQMSELKYSYSFAELLDRCQIVELKEINSEKPNGALAQEITDILNDIQVHLNEKPMTANEVRSLIVMCFVNQYIFLNEDDVREDMGNIDKMTSEEKENLLHRVLKTHKLNSLRGLSKKIIQEIRGGRVDPKLNYGSAANNSVWNISW